MDSAVAKAGVRVSNRVKALYLQVPLFTGRGAAGRAAAGRDRAATFDHDHARGRGLIRSRALKSGPLSTPLITEGHPQDPRADAPRTGQCPVRRSLQDLCGALRQTATARLQPRAVQDALAGRSAYQSPVGEGLRPRRTRCARCCWPWTSWSICDEYFALHLPRDLVGRGG